MTSNSTALPAPFAWVELPGKGCSIGKYPLTNAQYAPFVAAGGYEQRQWWTDAGWDAKLQGLTTDWNLGQSVPTETPWNQPRYWGDPLFNAPNQPVVGVSWHEAMAFCRWLSAATGESIALPTSDQWQYAAQGDDGRLYPWGNEWDCARCNNSVKPCESDRTTPVTQYEGQNDSPFGVVDLSGNVWEWCETAFTGWEEQLPGQDVRVIRGGGWMHFTNADCRTTFVHGDLASAWYSWRGFRLVRYSPVP